MLSIEIGSDHPQRRTLEVFTIEGGAATTHTTVKLLSLPAIQTNLEVAEQHPVQLARHETKSQPAVLDQVHCNVMPAQQTEVKPHFIALI